MQSRDCGRSGLFPVDVVDCFGGSKSSSESSTSTAKNETVANYGHGAATGNGNELSLSLPDANSLNRFAAPSAFGTYDSQTYRYHPDRFFVAC